MILAILNLHVTMMLPIMFLLNLTKGLGGYVVWKFSRWPPWRPSWILEWEDFINSKSPWFGKICDFKIFKMAAMEIILDINTEPFSQF